MNYELRLLSLFFAKNASGKVGSKYYNLCIIYMTSNMPLLDARMPELGKIPKKMKKIVGGKS